MIKAAFFDIDGTLVSFRTHTIPDSTIEAMRCAKERGVKLFIATGRPRLFLSSLDGIDSLIDGYITCNGAYCFMGERVLCRNTLPREQVARIVDECRAKGVTCAVVGSERLAIINDTEELRRVFFEMLKIDMHQFRTPLDDVLSGDILQVIPFLSPEQETELLPQLPDLVGARWHPAFVDVTRHGTDKGRALADVAQAIDIDQSETIAFGDGGNDIPMLRAAGIGVAMGNADDSVKAAADYVTTSVDDDGIANAFRHFGVL